MKESILIINTLFYAEIIRRWFVLTYRTLYTFKDSKVYKDPTEIVSLRDVNTIKSSDDETNRENSFVIIIKICQIDSLIIKKLEVGARRYYMVASNLSDKELWIGSIGNLFTQLRTKEYILQFEKGKQMVKLTQRKFSSDEEDD